MKKILFLTTIIILFTAQGVNAAVTFSDLGTAAPPTSFPGHSLTAFDQTPQAAIVNSTDVTTIPGSPFPGDLTTNIAVNKRAIGDGWATWSHGYTGVVYMVAGNTVIMTMPPGTGAFYFYAEPNSFAILDITASSDSGTTSGAIGVDGSGGANGFGFYASAGESISMITVTTTDSEMAIGEFGVATNGVVTGIPTLSEWSLLILSLMIVGLGVLTLRRHNPGI